MCCVLVCFFIGVVFEVGVGGYCWCVVGDGDFVVIFIGFCEYFF